MNEDVVRRIYDAWAREDRPGPAELLDPGVEYVNPPGAIEPGTRSGLGEFAAAVEKVFEAWEYWRAEIEGRESALWTLRDGKVLRYEWFHDADDAFDHSG